jgi:LL-diaminopimelate aminotransferase
LIGPSKFITEMRPYAFAQIDRIKDDLQSRGVDVIDFGVGDPTSPTPEIVRSACKEALDRRATSGYPSYQGSDEFREAVSRWFGARFGTELDPATELTTTIGSKQAIFMLPLAYVDPGDFVLIPDPGYPPYTTGARARQGRCHYLPLVEENDFYPDLSGVPGDVASRTKILWINYPNNPTTKIATRSFMKEAIDFCSDNDVLLASDEAYSELYYDEKPGSILGVDGAKDISLVFNSLSKRSSMTGHRIGFVAGRSELLDPFKKVQTQSHSGAATFIQDGGVAALSDESHVEDLRREYREKRNLIVKTLEDLGSEGVYAEATFYVWAKAPGGLDSLEFSQRLLSDAHVNTVPGKALSQTAEAGGDFVRFAMVPSLERTGEACIRIGEMEL